LNITKKWELCVYIEQGYKIEMDFLYTALIGSIGPTAHGTSLFRIIGLFGHRCDGPFPFLTGV
jgi:hypothetical protein